MDACFEQFLDLLCDILIDHAEGLAEYDLLALLCEQGLPVFSEVDRSDSLNIFRRHFLLFHLLYRLRDQLYREQKGHLEIHCLKIRLTPWNPANALLPGRPDTLREYYLDLGKLTNTTRKDVEELLENFWEMYLRADRRPESLVILGLPPNASQAEIKKRFRKLARRHHPDHGGVPEKFRKIHRAAELLLAE